MTASSRAGSKSPSSSTSAVISGGSSSDSEPPPILAKSSSSTISSIVTNSAGFSPGFPSISSPPSKRSSSASPGGAVGRLGELSDPILAPSSLKNREILRIQGFLGKENKPHEPHLPDFSDLFGRTCFGFGGSFFIEINIILGSGQRVRSPGYQKLCARVIHIRDNRKGQPNRGAMEEPRLGGTALMITVAPTPGKYALAAGASTTSTSTQSAAALKYTANVGKSVFLPKIT
uniref:Uncharacterized protein n=1 Tax=Lutzomyia longipalpis TaxID=7200 RepID=A0A1B0CML2_LUTLO